MLRNNTKESIRKRKQLEKLQRLARKKVLPSVLDEIKKLEADLVEYKAPEVEYA